MADEHDHHDHDDHDEHDHHDHAHGHHHGHHHHATGDETGKAIATAFFLNLAFTVIEIVGGIWTNSLAILSDALHDLGDSLSLGISYFFERYSKRAQDGRYSYGYRRYSLLGAMVNLTVLAAGSVVILTQAIPRLLDPQPVNGTGMTLLAVLGLGVNGLAVLRLRGQKGLNAKVMALHMLEDAMGWAAVLIVGIVLIFWDLPILDPLLSLGITAFVLFNVYRNLRSTSAVFLQAVPDDFDINGLDARIKKLENVESVHHTHVWSLDGENHVLTTHIVVAENSTRETVVGLKSAVKEMTRGLGLAHTTVEIEYEEKDCSMD